ncbi:FeS cluster assembly protein sufD [Raoultella terrigena]|uniref:FeS cluster assembly protein sufD n=1 Tax=Raoultella terrigena TaxID=577 RepID=A0A485BNG8_RAOTE|nr:FeS cluster assembly protein sufD [Raoultella terrigena]
MAGLPNSSNALQQWHHLFEQQAEQRTPEAHQHLQQALRLGLPTRKHEHWKYTRWMRCSAALLLPRNPRR